MDCPSERGRNYTPVKPVRCVLPEAPCREQMISADFQSVPIITGEATLPLRWLPPATPLWTCCPRTPCATSCSRSASFTIGRYTFLKGNLSSQVQQQIGKDFRGGVPVEAFARTMIQLFCKLGQSLCRKRNLIGVFGNVLPQQAVDLLV